MIHSLPRTRFQMALLAVSGVFLLISCGSYQQASYYDNDGIYSNGTRQYTEQNPNRNNPNNRQNNTNEYGDYFQQRSQEIDQIMSDEVFTDIDGYYSGVDGDNTQVAEGNYFDDYNDYNGNAGWGDNASNVSINFYDNGWNNWGYGGFGYGGWGYNGFYGNRWNRFGYGGWGGGFGWGGGYGWGYGGYGGWGLWWFWI